MVNEERSSSLLETHPALFFTQRPPLSLILNLSPWVAPRATALVMLNLKRLTSFLHHAALVTLES